MVCYNDPQTLTGRSSSPKSLAMGESATHVFDGRTRHVVWRGLEHDGSLANQFRGVAQFG